MFSSVLETSDMGLDCRHQNGSRLEKAYLGGFSRVGLPSRPEDRGLRKRRTLRLKDWTSGPRE